MFSLVSGFGLSFGGELHCCVCFDNCLVIDYPPIREGIRFLLYFSCIVTLFSLCANCTGNWSSFLVLGRYISVIVRYDETVVVVGLAVKLAV